MLAYTNRVVSYPRHMRVEVRKLVDSMSESQKQFVLDAIEIRRNVSNLTNQHYDLNILNYAAKLLQTNNENLPIMMSVPNNRLLSYNRDIL